MRSPAYLASLCLLARPLLQNVADHLSSRAYMELASRFPAPRRRQMQAAAAAAAADGSQAGAGNGSSSSSSGDSGVGGGGEGGMGREPSGSLGDGGWLSCEDSVDWEAVRNASQEELSDAIKCRGMQNRCVGVYRGQGTHCRCLRGKDGMTAHSWAAVHGWAPCHQRLAQNTTHDVQPCTGFAIPYCPCAAHVLPLYRPLYRRILYCRLADQIIRFLNQIRQHNLQRLRKQRREAARLERAAVGGLLSDMLDSVGASEAFEVPAGAGEPAGAAQPALAAAPAAAGGSPRRRHIALEYEGEGEDGWGPRRASPAAAAAAARQPQAPAPRQAQAPAAAAMAAGAVAQQERAEQQGSGGSSSGGVKSSGAGGGCDGDQEPTARELLSLEWLREAPDEEARNYLLNIDGGLQ